MFQDHNKYPIVRRFNEDDSFKPREVVMKYLYHWPLFFTFLAISLSLALVYLKITQPVYDIKASLLIKEDNINNSNQKTGIALQELDLATPNRLVDNEIEVLKSRRLMVQLVDTLQLWMDYQTDKKIGKENLYGISPVKISFTKVADKIEGNNILIYIKDGYTYYLTQKDKVAKPYSFGNLVTNSLGTFVVNKTDLYQNYIDRGIQISFSDFDKTVSAYQKGIEIALLNKKSPTVGLSLSDAVIPRGKDILNQLILIYNAATLNEKNRITKSTMDFIDSRLSTITKELATVENETEQFKKNRGLTDITSESKIYLENAQANDSKLNDVKVKLNVVNGIEDYINSNAANKRAPSTLGIEDPGLNSMIARLSQLELDRSRLLATTPESNPLFGPLNSQIAELKNAVKINIGNVKLTLENSQQKLQSFDSKFKSDISKVPGEERQLLEILRQKNVKQDLFLYLLKKKEEISLSYASTLADARVIDSAYAGPKKWPNTILILAIAIIAGLGLPIALLIGRSLFNDKINGKSGIAKETEIPILGDIREVITNNPLIIFDPYQIAAVEQFRYLRTKLLALHGAANKGRITLITSSIAEEGKGFISSNIGLSLAASGRKVVLVDLDLRKNKLGNLFEIDASHTGLIDYLEGKILKEEVVKKSEKHFNLDVITSGLKEGLAANPELIEKYELEILMTWLKQNYDDILIYTPPIRLVADALMLSKFSTVLLFIVRSNLTKKAYLKFIDGVQKNNEFNKVNIVLNGAKPEDGISEYGRKYYPNGKQKPNIGFGRKLKSFFKRF